MNRQEDARKVREVVEILQRHQFGLVDVSDPTLVSLDLGYELQAIANLIETQPDYVVDWAPSGSTTA